MIRLGEKQKLKLIKKVEFGVYLAEDDRASQEERILLPAKYVPREAGLGSELEVFVYRDSKDRLIATTLTPHITLHEVKRLKVKEMTRIGAFLDWGLEKDLLLPFHEQTTRVDTGCEVLVALYIDKSERLCATMNVYEYLSTGSPYKKDDRVAGTVYETSKNFGLFVAVDDRYSALIPLREAYGRVEIGDTVSARVLEVREDGKLNLSIRDKAYLQIGTDSEEIVRLIESYDGVLPFNDKASPETIKRETGMSKNEFKRAVGHLLKDRRIAITDKSIRLL